MNSTKILGGPSTGEWLTVQDVARRVGCSKSTILRAIYSNELKAADVNNDLRSVSINVSCDYRIYEAWLADYLAHFLRQCRGCGKEYQQCHGNGKYCSDDCILRTKRRVWDGVRRARRLNLHSEPVNPRKVFERDGWRCRICRIPTLRKHMNTDDSPELDHIVPEARGGSHTYSNTQLLCRKCNNWKSDKLLGDLDLGGYKIVKGTDF